MSVNGQPRELDLQIKEQLGELAEAVRGLKETNEWLREDIRDLNKRRWLSTGTIATAVVAFWAGVIELVKLTL